MKLGQAAKRVAGLDWYLSQYEAYLSRRSPEAEGVHLARLLARPERDRTRNWSASGANTCLRQRQFTFLGMPKATLEEKSLNIFANGDYVHLRHQVFGLVAGHISQAEVPVRLDEYNLQGTMDGVLSNGLGLELKSINTYGFSDVSTWGPKKDHIMQVQSYMLASGIDAFHMVYEDKNTNLCREFLVEADPFMQDAVRRDLDVLNKSLQTQQLEPMLDECKQLKGKYAWCPYASICEGATWPTPSGSNVLRIQRTSSSAAS